LRQNSGLWGLDLDNCFIGLDVSDMIARGDVITLAAEPLDQLALAYSEVTERHCDGFTLDGDESGNR
jgi:hypothetical protein